jgi:hypothetical protein
MRTFLLFFDIFALTMTMAVAAAHTTPHFRLLALLDLLLLPMEL